MNRTYIHIITYFFLLFALFGVSTRGLSQEKTLVQEILEDLDFQGRPYWQKEFEGLLDGVQPIYMVFVTDNQFYKAICQFKSSGKKFYFEGEFVNDQIVLYEYDEQGRGTGSLVGDMTDESFYGEWRDIKGLERLSVELQQIGALSSSNMLFVPKFVKAFASIDQSKPIYLLLTNTGEGLLANIATKDSTWSQLLECEDETCAVFKSLVGDNDQVFQIRFSMAKQSAELELIADDMLKASYTLRLQNELSFEFMTHADYYTRLEWMLPTTAQTNFRRWSAELMYQWWQNQLKLSHELCSDEENHGVSKRLGFPSYASMVIDLLTDRYIVGHYTVQSSIDKENSIIPFIFDIKDQKNIQAEEILYRHMPQENWPKMVEESFNRMEIEDEIKPWVKIESFKHISFGASGIIVRTDFNPIYGVLSLNIPYQKVFGVFSKGQHTFSKNLKSTGLWR